jgi:hypothetical protein
VDGQFPFDFSAGFFDDLSGTTSMQPPPNGAPHHYCNTTGYFRQPRVSQPQAFGQPGAYGPNDDPLFQDSSLAQQANVEPMCTSRNRELFSTPQGQPPQSFPSCPPSHSYNQQQRLYEVPVARVRTAHQVETESDVLCFAPFAFSSAPFTAQDSNFLMGWSRDDFIADPMMGGTTVPKSASIVSQRKGLSRSPKANIVPQDPELYVTSNVTKTGIPEYLAGSQYGLPESVIDQHESESNNRLEGNTEARDEDISKTHKPTIGTGNETKQCVQTTEEAQFTKNVYGMYFNNFEDASDRVQGLNWPPRLDQTLPAGPAARRAIVKELLAAMNVTSDVKDKKGSVFKKRWAQAQGPDSSTLSGEEGDQNDENPPHPATRVNGFFKQQWMEKKCWELLVRALSLIRITDARR